MTNITVKNFKGDEYSGTWNGKSYPSRIAGRPELHRIFLDNEAIHIDSEEFERVGGNAEKSAKEKSAFKINETAKRLATEEKIALLQKLYYDFDVQDALNKKNARATNEMHKAMLKLFGEE
jgi:hypothetical protein